MRSDNSETTLEEAISKCLNDGTPECLKELSELVREQKDLLENKYLLYKMVIRYLMRGDAAGAAATPRQQAPGAQSGRQAEAGSSSPV